MKVFKLALACSTDYNHSQQHTLQNTKTFRQIASHATWRLCNSAQNPGSSTRPTMGVRCVTGGSHPDAQKRWNAKQPLLAAHARQAFSRGCGRGV